MSTDRRPSTLDGIKSLAREIRKKEGISLHEAYNAAARAAGYSNLKHAQNNLAFSSGETWVRLPPATVDEFPFHGRSEFHAENLRRWITSVRKVVPGGIPRRSWSRPSQIIENLAPFMGQNLNHAHLPSGGGHDFLSVGLSAELGCLELRISRGLAYVVRPKRLTLEIIEAQPGESFLLLELGELERKEAYVPSEGVDADIAARVGASEELTELAPGSYVPRWHWDENEGPDGEPLPDDARLVVRWMGGQMLLVAKGSVWNGDPRTYRGLHSKRRSGGTFQA